MNAVRVRRLVMAGVAVLFSWIIVGTPVLTVAWTVIPRHGYPSTAVCIGINWWATNVGEKVWRWSAPCD